MAINKHPSKGPGWWRIRISHGRKGKDEYITYEGSEAEALAFEADLRGVSQELSDQRPNDVLGRYLTWIYIHRSERTAKDTEETLPRILDIIGNKPLSLLRQQDFNRYKSKRIDDGVTKSTINIELNRLRSLMTFASEELKIQIGEKPKLFTKKQTQPPAKVVLTPDEIFRILQQLHGDKKTIIMLYAYCGLRRNEALTLQRKNIDLAAGVLNITGKGSKHRIVPIVGQDLQQRLEDACTHYPKKRRGKQIDPCDQVRPKSKDEYLFLCARTGKPYQNIKKSLKSAATRAGIIKPVWNHLLRHSSATAAISAGVNLRSLQVMLGHSDIRMTEIYTHLASDVLKAEAEKMATLHQQANLTSGMSGSRNDNKGKVIQLVSRRRP